MFNGYQTLLDCFYSGFILQCCCFLCCADGGDATGDGLTFYMHSARAALTYAAAIARPWQILECSRSTDKSGSFCQSAARSSCNTIFYHASQHAPQVSSRNVNRDGAYFERTKDVLV